MTTSYHSHAHREGDFASPDPRRLGSRSCIAIARRTSARLKRKFPWIPADDLYSYALYGLVRSARLYQSDRQVPFGAFAARKCLYVAIDEMRHDGLVRRGDRPDGPTFKSLEAATASETDHWRGVCDKHSVRDTDRLEAREWCAAVLTGLAGRDRHLLMLRYSNELTFRQIGRVLGLSESAVCVRHASLLRRLRRRARANLTGRSGNMEVTR